MAPFPDVRLHAAPLEPAGWDRGELLRAGRILDWLGLEAEERCEHWQHWCEEFLTKEGKPRAPSQFASKAVTNAHPDLARPFLDECDRIAAPTRELRKLGVDVEEGPDYMVIAPLAGSTRRANPAHGAVEIETYHDHRIAMSFGVLGSRLPGLRILDPGCVAKTYPNYWRDWQRARSASR
jgi:hypothetical protein